MGKKGRKPWQEKEFQIKHEKLKEFLSKQKDGVTIAELKKISGTGRRIIAKHLDTFINKDKTVVVEPHSWPRVYYWLPHVDLQIQAAKYKLLWEIERLPPVQKLWFLTLRKKSGDPVALRKLKELFKGLEDVVDDDREFVETPPEKRLAVLMKRRKELEKGS